MPYGWLVLEWWSLTMALWCLSRVWNGVSHDQAIQASSGSDTDIMYMYVTSLHWLLSKTACHRHGSMRFGKVQMWVPISQQSIVHQSNDWCPEKKETQFDQGIWDHLTHDSTWVWWSPVGQDVLRSREICSRFWRLDPLWFEYCYHLTRNLQAL